jgi:S-adenosyl-L-methionine hydrolase (adenosine-forming)
MAANSALAHSPIVTLTTDFGLSDHFVGTMKGVMLRINPALQFVDISHQLDSYNISGAAFTLGLAYSYFPDNTIHLAVVDPGVGSSRRAIVARARGYLFVAPDNGLLSLVYEREPECEVREITAEHYFLKPVSHTFHGRDIFAPVAAWLSKGIAPENFGERITDYCRLELPRPQRTDAQHFRATVLKADRFGNLITNLAPADAPELFLEPSPSFRLAIQGRIVGRLYRSYSAGGSGELFAILGSSGYLEVCMNRASAASALQAGPGTEVTLELGPGSRE